MTDQHSSVRTLPARPSLESLRKQAKALARAVAAEDADALARVRAQLPRSKLPLSLRDAQLALAREYGFAGWNDLRAEVLKRIGEGLEWAALEAERAIHDNDVGRLKTLITEHPGLLTWRDEQDHPLMQSTAPYSMDVTNPGMEAQHCRPDCAALLIDAGADLTPSVWDNLIRSGAVGMMKLLDDKKALPPTLATRAALGDRDGVRALLDGAEGDARDAVNFAFVTACRFKHEAVATTLLHRAVALDPDLGAQIDRWGGRDAFVADMIAHCPSLYGPTAPWPAFVIRQLMDAMHADDLATFMSWLESQPWLLDDAHVPLQVEILEQTAIYDREPFLRALLDHDPAVLHAPKPPTSNALIYACDYGNAHLVPLLARIWPVPDDLPHAAALGNLAAVERWFDADGQPALGDLGGHHRNVRPGQPTVQQVLDAALGWAVLNKQLETAELLLGRGADIDTDWATHEPASILHEAAIQGNFEAARFLVEHGADMTIRDHRWNATAAGWAFHAANDVEMATYLQNAEEARRGD